MDAVAGSGWRLVLAPGSRAPAEPGLPLLRVIQLGDDGLREAEGVAAAWFRRHECVAALVRPDNYVYGVAASAIDITPLVDELAAALARNQQETA